MAFGRKLRNRLVGLLVLVSLVLILLPMVMRPEDTYKKSDKSIAVDQNGAMTDSSGRMVESGEHDYSDLLSPVEDNDVSPGDIAAQNSGSNANSGAIPVPPEIKTSDVPQNQGASSGAALNSNAANPMESNQAAPSPVPAKPAAREIPKDPDTQVEMLKSARNNANQNKPKAQSASSSSQSETLVSRRAQQKNDKTASHNSKSTAQSVPNSGSYSVQVGVFSNPANAQKVASKLRSAGIAVRTENATLGGKSVVRVLAGSATSREAAQGIAQRVSQITGSKANVVAN